jgi:hypothetical protein
MPELTWAPIKYSPTAISFLGVLIITSILLIRLLFVVFIQKGGGTIPNVPGDFPGTLSPLMDIGGGAVW